MQGSITPITEEVLLLRYLSAVSLSFAVLQKAMHQFSLALVFCLLKVGNCRFLKGGKEGQKCY